MARVLLGGSERRDCRGMRVVTPRRASQRDRQRFRLSWRCVLFPLPDACARVPGGRLDHAALDRLFSLWLGLRSARHALRDRWRHGVLSDVRKADHTVDATQDRRNNVRLTTGAGEVRGRRFNVLGRWADPPRLAERGIGGKCGRSGWRVARLAAASVHPDSARGRGARGAHPSHAVRDFVLHQRAGRPAKAVGGSRGCRSVFRDFRLRDGLLVRAAIRTPERAADVLPAPACASSAALLGRVWCITHLRAFGPSRVGRELFDRKRDRVLCIRAVSIPGRPRFGVADPRARLDTEL